MAAYLTSIIFDKDTSDYLCGEIVDAGQEETGFSLMDSCADLGQRFKLKHLPTGHYSLVISADIETSPMAKLTLMNAETSEIIKSVSVDLKPVMVSSVLYREEYDEACKKFEDAPIGKKGEKEWERDILKISTARVEYFEGIFLPYIPENNSGFYNELLAAFDLLTGYFVQAQTIDTTQQIKTLSPSGPNPFQSDKPVIH